MMPLPSEPLESEAEDLSVAAWSLADAFEGVVSNEAGHLVPRPLSSLPSVGLPLDVSEMRETSLIESPDDSPQTVQLDLFASGKTVEPEQISLRQLRQWYAIAQSLDRAPSHLARIRHPSSEVRLQPRQFSSKN